MKLFFKTFCRDREVAILENEESCVSLEFLELTQFYAIFLYSHNTILHSGAKFFIKSDLKYLGIYLGTYLLTPNFSMSFKSLFIPMFFHDIF